MHLSFDPADPVRGHLRKQHKNPDFLGSAPSWSVNFC